MKNYLRLEEKQRELTHITNILMLAHWDAATMLASSSVDSRFKEIATLSALHHKLLTSSEFHNLLDSAQREFESLSEVQKANLKLIRKQYDKATCISEDMLTKHSLICSNTEFMWRKAKQENDFKSVEKSFDEVFNSTREIAKVSSQKFGMSEYDVLLDGYDSGRNIDEITQVYTKLKTELPVLIQKIQDKQENEKVLPLTQKIDKETQKQIGLKVMQAMGFDFDKGRLDISSHPFCSGSNDDVRITTRYDENNFLTGVYGVIHETGHALYQLNLPSEYRDQPVGNHMGMSFHESQSLIMELQACTSLEFTEFLSKLMHDEFSIKGPEYSGENLYKLVTRVKPSFIRVEADEVTYPLHVIIRFELEQDIIYNNLQAKDLPALWNEKMQKYLGITPSTDTLGCLQDIHWPAGMIGYFPSYTNGAIIASMLMHKAKLDVPNVFDSLKEGSFVPLNSFLNDNLRSLGSKISSSELLKTATSYEKINADIFINYIKEKYQVN